MQCLSNSRFESTNDFICIRNFPSNLSYDADKVEENIRYMVLRSSKLQSFEKLVRIPKATQTRPFNLSQNKILTDNEIPTDYDIILLTDDAIKSEKLFRKAVKEFICSFICRTLARAVRED